MICPECHQGMVQVHALSQMWEKGYKTIPCPRCNGSGIAYCCDGEDASCDAVTLFSDQSKTIEDTSLVTYCRKGSSRNGNVDQACLQSRVRHQKSVRGN